MMNNKLKKKTVYCINQFPAQSGVTFIELLLYVAIVSIFLSTLIPFAWNVIGGGAKSMTQQEVYSQARYVSERIKYEIRNANAITSPGIGLSGGILNINTPTATIIDLNAGKVRISTDGGTSYTNLNSNDTTVTNLIFKSYSSVDTKTKHVGFTFDMASSYTGSKKQYKDDISIRGSAELRSN